jgi:hypothetical protein
MDITLGKYERCDFPTFPTAHRHSEAGKTRCPITGVEYARFVRCKWSFYPGVDPILFPHPATYLLGIFWGIS